MRAPPNARYVICRAPDVNNSSISAGKRVGMLLGARLHLMVQGGSHPSFHPKGRAAADVEVLRDATPREVQLGMALH